MTDFTFSNKDQTLTVYNFSSDTGELIGVGDCFVPANTGLPAYCTDIKPPKEKVGFALVFDADKSAWQYIADHRGETRWNIQNRQMQVIDTLGDFSTTTTEKSPTSDFDVWNGSEWVKDVEAEKAFYVESAARELKELMSNATENINTLQDAVDLGLATDNEVDSLKSWRTYRVLLSRIDINAAPDIDWPEVPNVA